MRLRVAYTIPLVLAAVLLFVLEPLAGRMLLPLAGGSAQVWNTCLVFFQAALLAGYAWAHVSFRLFAPSRQPVVHAALVALAFAALPIRVDSPGSGASLETTFEVLVALSRALLLPFVAVAATAPTLQRWYARHPGAGDPYPLYAASNAGSFAALLLGPVVLDRWLGIDAQRGAWRVGYAVLAVAIGACALAVRRVSASAPETKSFRGTARRELRWLVLAAIPSSLLAGVSQYLATDIASIPLFWVVPLALYLLTFTFAFATKPPFTWKTSSRAIVLPATATALVLAVEANRPAPLIIAVHLATFFLACMVCHTALAADRPPSEGLTRFFLVVSAGGVLGGSFNALLAPLVFRGVYEYPIALCAAFAMRAPIETKSSRGAPARNDLAWSAGIFAATALLTRAAYRFTPPSVALGAGLVFAIPLFVSMRQYARPLRFALCLGAIVAGAAAGPGAFGRVIFQRRSFYGVVRVAIDAQDGMHRLVHGSTVHGLQDPARPRIPLAYYHPEGPAGAIVRRWHEHAVGDVGVVGLGAGALAAYARAGERWTFFELDPLVVAVASDARYFTFLRDAFGDHRPELVVGDARISLRRIPSGRFGLLVLDAFSSDTVPVHLLVREAFATYRRALRPDGLLAIHVSNRYFDLRPIVGALAHDAGLRAACFDDHALTAAAMAAGHAPSTWCVVPMIDAADDSWSPTEWIAPPTANTVWTDDRAYVLDAWR